jgi:hypothetical protein
VAAVVTYLVEDNARQQICSTDLLSMTVFSFIAVTRRSLVIGEFHAHPGLPVADLRIADE